MLKLSLLIPTLDRSGAEKQLTLLATHLPRDEFAVDVITLDRAGPKASACSGEKNAVSCGPELRHDETAPAHAPCSRAT